jgi:hypothetical protein
MAVTSWYQFDNGATLGQKGSEGGSIVLDEEHPLGARITLECDATIAPFAITCGIYGWMVHTRFFGVQSEARGDYDLMRGALSGLLEKANENVNDSSQVLMEGVSAFVEIYP